MMCVVAGDDVRGLTQQQMHENVITGLRRGAPSPRTHVTLILEPMNIRVDHKGIACTAASRQCASSRKSTRGFVKINWDLYHMQISEGDLCGHMRDGFAAAGYYQLADHPGRNEPGTGEVHYPRVLKQLHDRATAATSALSCVPGPRNSKRPAR